MCNRTCMLLVTRVAAAAAAVVAAAAAAWSMANRTSHVTRHTSRVTRHTSRVTRHTPHQLRAPLFHRRAVRSQLLRHHDSITVCKKARESMRFREAACDVMMMMMMLMKTTTTTTPPCMPLLAARSTRMHSPKPHVNRVRSLPTRVHNQQRPLHAAVLALHLHTTVSGGHMPQMRSTLTRVTSIDVSHVICKGGAVTCCNRRVT